MICIDLQRHQPVIFVNRSQLVIVVIGFPSVWWPTSWLEQNDLQTPATSTNYFFYMYKKDIRPVGYSDLNLQSNVYFVLAGPCESCNEFDQFSFSKCLTPGFWAISFWYMHALLINVFFWLPEPVAWNKCFFWTHRHCHCCASVLIPAIQYPMT